MSCEIDYPFLNYHYTRLVALIICALLLSNVCEFVRDEVLNPCPFERRS
jgi:hypothetical protein